MATVTDADCQKELKTSNSWWFGGLVVWLSGCLVVWWFGGLVVWLFGGLVVWSSGCLVIWSSRCLDISPYRISFTHPLLRNYSAPSALIGICNPDVYNIRIFNPIIAL